MKLGMKYEKMAMPCEACDEKEHFPMLHISLDGDKVDLLEKLAKKGTAKISYEIERIVKEKSDDKTSGSVTLKIKSIDPMDRFMEEKD